MVTTDITTLELSDAWTASGSKVRVDFPLTAATGTASTAVVYFELEPGDFLATHTDSAEEILLVLAGEGELVVGDERASVSTGSMAVVPALVPHGARATGTEPLRVVGFFGAGTIDHVFSEPLQPFGIDRFTTPAPVEAVA